MSDLDLAYEQCRLITRREAKNFYYAFITLPPQKRKAIYAAYAFCRICDDAADADVSVAQKLDLLGDVRGRLSSAYSGHPEGPIFTALADAARTFEIPDHYYEQVVTGVETDLTKTRYQDFQELRAYCYSVASVVGLICIKVFGYSNPRAEQYAVDLGLAMQLTNIMRDIREDLDRDRIYLPLDEIRDSGYSVEELQAGVVNEPFQLLMKLQAARARRYFDSGYGLLPLLSARSRACPAVLGQIYSHILDRIEDKGFNVFDGRVSLTRREKYLVTARTWMKSVLPMGARLRAS